MFFHRKIVLVQQEFFVGTTYRVFYAVEGCDQYGDLSRLYFLDRSGGKIRQFRKVFLGKSEYQAFPFYVFPNHFNPMVGVAFGLFFVHAPLGRIF